MRSFHSRYVHGEGHTVFHYTKDGKYLVTSGIDSELRRWESSAEDEEFAAVIIREPATCIVIGNNVIYIGSGHFVEAYECPNMCFSERPLQFSATVTDVDISSDDKILVAGAGDMKIKIKNLVTNEIIELLDHSAPVLRVVLKPDVTYLASSSCDGSVKVWNLTNNEPIKTIHNILPQGNDFWTAESLGTPAWYEKSGSCLVVIEYKKVCFYSMSDWSFCFELTCEKIRKNLSIISFSRSQHYLCGGTNLGEVIIWNVQKRQLTNYYEDLRQATITTMSWHPTKFELACSDRIGRVFVLTSEMICDPEDDIEEEEVVNEDPVKINDNEDDENTISISQIKSSTLLTVDEGSNDKTEKDSEADDDETDSQVQEWVKTDFQPAFQPSSTPSHFEHRYMVWNSVGIVLSFNSEKESSIDVEFHDTMLHHALHRRNNQEYTMAALSTKIICLASSRSMTCIHINGWDEKREWMMDMPEEESITAVATSGNWVCCATDLNQLRFFGYTGMQRQILAVPGPVVCVNGHERLLIVIIHMGVGLPGCQNLAYRIFDVTDFFVKAVTPFQPLPLSPQSKLKWIGFTDEGTPCTYDSAGILRLSRDFLNWEVACNIRQHCKNKSDGYFMIGVSERLQCARCILCKGSGYPVTLPRPTVVEIPLKIPLCSPEDNKTINEDIFWRHVFSLPVLVLASQENSEYDNALKDFDKELKQSIMKLFAEAHRNKADMRAVSLASLMSETPLEKAMKLVKKQGRYLFEKLHKIVPKDWEELRQGPVKNFRATQFHGLISSENENENESNSVLRNKYTYKSQDDMFELSQPSTSNGSGLLVSCRGKDSPQKQKTTSSTSTSAAYVNPFKVQNKEDQTPKGLSFFNSVTQSSLKPAKPDTSSEKVTKGKQGNPSRDKSNEASKKMKFFNWFNTQKSELQEKYPDVSMSELTKLAMKLYREEVSGGMKNQRTKNFESDGDFEQSPESKRQKTEDEISKVKASAADKLGAFNFVK